MSETKVVTEMDKTSSVEVWNSAAIAAGQVLNDMPAEQAREALVFLIHDVFTEAFQLGAEWERCGQPKDIAAFLEKIRKAETR